MKQSLIIAALLISLLLSSCDEAYEKRMPNDNNLTEVKRDELAFMSKNEKSLEKDLSKVFKERKLVKTGEISFETNQQDESRTQIVKLIQEMKGYIQNDEIFLDDLKRKVNKLVLRIPADKFDSYLEKVSEHSKRIDSKKIQVSDVTDEYFDIDTRLKNKKELETRYLELLKQTKSISDIIEIQNALADIRDEIERIEGRLLLLQNDIAYSTLTVKFYEQSPTEIGFFARISDSLKSGWNNFLWFLISLVDFWPFIILFIIFIILFKKYRPKNFFRKRNNKI